jgi:hypothetical protein
MATSFKLEHDFLDIPLEVFESYLNDPELNHMLEEGLGFDERTLIKRKDLKDGVEWQFLVKKCGDIPKAVQKFLKDDGLTWQETSRFNKNDHAIYWEITPESKLLKFHGQGTWVLSRAADGCKRVIEGSITVDIPLVGKMVEGFIVNELVKTYEIEPTIQKKFYKNILKKTAHAR